jgi:hypothetical protein
MLRLRLGAVEQDLVDKEQQLQDAVSRQQELMERVNLLRNKEMHVQEENECLVKAKVTASHMWHLDMSRAKFGELTLRSIHDRLERVYLLFALCVYLLAFWAPILHRFYGSAASLLQFHRVMYVKYVESVSITLKLELPFSQVLLTFSTRSFTTDKQLL